jgi:hypothetical protein
MAAVGMNVVLAGGAVDTGSTRKHVRSLWREVGEWWREVGE